MPKKATKKNVKKPNPARAKTDAAFKAKVKKPAKKAVKTPAKKTARKPRKVVSTTTPVKDVVVAPVVDASGVVMITPVVSDVVNK